MEGSGRAWVGYKGYPGIVGCLVLVRPEEGFALAIKGFTGSWVCNRVALGSLRKEIAGSLFVPRSFPSFAAQDSRALHQLRRCPPC